MAVAEHLGMSLGAFYSLPELEQADWIVRHEIDRETCKFHGGPVEECGDDDRDWFPQIAMCWPTAQLEAAKALYADAHEARPYHNGSPERFSDPTAWAKERSHDFPFSYADGVSFWMAPVDLPGPDFLSGPAGSDADLDEPD